MSFKKRHLKKKNVLGGNQGMPLSLSGYYNKGEFPEVCGLDIFYMWLALLQYPGCVKDMFFAWEKSLQL